jgi:hypothetical protein
VVAGAQGAEVMLLQHCLPAGCNTAKEKLLAGQQVFSFTQSTMDSAGYCEKAKHYDFTWFEMQRSTRWNSEI